MHGHESIWLVVALAACLLVLWLYRRSRRRLGERGQGAGRLALLGRKRAGRAARQVRVRPPSHTQHPIVLAHGWGAFHHLFPSQLGWGYFRDIPDALRAHGHVVHVARVPPTASIDLRAQHLAQQIKCLDMRVNVIAHSMGGLDARLAIARYGLDERVASLTTIGTPHRGTPLADVALALGGFSKSRGVLSKLGLNVDGVYDLSTKQMREFNRRVLDAPDVQYTNVVAAVDLDAGGVHAMLAYGHRFLAHSAGPNDGIVPSLSQVWGETLEELDADHWAQIGWFARFDVHGFYARLVRRLAARDL